MSLVMNPEKVVVPALNLPESRMSDLEVQCQIETSFAAVSAIRGEWDEAVLTWGSTIYLTFDWVQTWWEFYGEDKELRLFLFRRAGKLVGVIPIYLESFGAGFLTTKVARLVGANIPPKTFNPPVDPGCAEAIFARVFRHLFAVDRCDLLSFGPVAENWPVQRAFREACVPVADHLDSVAFHPRDVQTFFHLPPTFEGYLESLSSSERKNRLKRIRHLEKNHRVTLAAVAAPDEVEREFDAFAEMHARQWQAIGKGGHFEAWPRAKAYNRALVKAQARLGRVRFFQMLVDDEVVVSRYTFLLGNTIYSELPARKTGEHWDKLGVGGVSMIKFNQQLIEAGIGNVDSGLGGYEHKTQMGGDEIPVGVWHVVGRNSAGKVRRFLAVSKAINTLCHKIWYRRIVPHLPKPYGRTQSLTWLRFDV